MPSQVTITVPQEYGYVILSASASFLVALWHSFRTSPFRHAAQVPHPNRFADSSTISKATSAASASEKAGLEKAAYLFNCAQASHGNFIENQPTFLAALLISGLKYPVTAAFLGAACVLCAWGMLLGIR